VRWFVRAGLGCIGVIAVLAVYDMLTTHVLHGPVNGRSLYVAVRDESGGVNPITVDEHRRCHPTRPPRVWTCSVDVPTGSAGGVDYRVRIRDGSSCWDGVGGGTGLPHRISGCVHLREE
jgi:hypothetical protein